MTIASELLRSDIAFETEPLPPGLTRLFVDLGPGNRLSVARRTFPTSTFSSENVALRTTVTNVAENEAKLQFVNNGAGERASLGHEACFVDVGPETQVTVRVVSPAGHRDILTMSAQDMPVDVEMEVGSSVSLNSGGRVTVVEQLGDRQSLGVFTSTASGSPLMVETTDDGKLQAWGTVDVPPVLSDHTRFSVGQLKILTSGTKRDPAVFLLIGPSAAGKTTVRSHMQRRLGELGHTVKTYTEFPLLLEMAQQGDSRFRLHADNNGFEMLDASAYQDALRKIVEQMKHDYQASIATPDFIIELAPDGFWSETLTIPTAILDAAHVMHIEVDADTCIERLGLRAQESGADNHHFDPNVWRALFAHDNSAFILQLATAREATGPIVSVFHNHPGADLIRAARQFAEYGSAISTAAGFQRLLGPSDLPMTMPGVEQSRAPGPTKSVRFTNVRSERLPVLFDKVRKTRLLKRPDVRVYEHADIKYDVLDPANVNFSTKYLMKSQLITLCRAYRSLYERGIDPFNLRGQISSRMTAIAST